MSMPKSLTNDLQAIRLIDRGGCHRANFPVVRLRRLSGIKEAIPINSLCSKTLIAKDTCSVNGD